MNLFLYIMIFILGTVFGSFFTLAVYRIPLKKDITHERSFCTTCGHRLEFLDLIPVLSYIFLKGKCRYCGEKIRIRYLLLEVLSGLVFILAYMSFNISFPYFKFENIMGFISFIFMYITLAILAGIDKEYKQIHIGVTIFGFVVHSVYILYLYILGIDNIYRYSIYFVIVLFAIILNIFLSKKQKEENKNLNQIVFNKAPYFLQIIMLSSYIIFYTNIKLFLIILCALIIEMIVYFIYNRLSKNKKEELFSKKIIPVGFLMNISTIGVIIITNFIKFY